MGVDAFGRIRIALLRYPVVGYLITCELVGSWVATCNPPPHKPLIIQSKDRPTNTLIPEIKPLTISAHYAEGFVYEFLQLPRASTNPCLYE